MGKNRLKKFKDFEIMNERISEYEDKVSLYAEEIIDLMVSGGETENRAMDAIDYFHSKGWIIEYMSQGLSVKDAYDILRKETYYK